jgi:hypothetical protein
MTETRNATIASGYARPPTKPRRRMGHGTARRKIAARPYSAIITTTSAPITATMRNTAGASHGRYSIVSRATYTL